MEGGRGQRMFITRIQLPRSPTNNGELQGLFIRILDNCNYRSPRFERAEAKTSSIHPRSFVPLSAVFFSTDEWKRDTTSKLKLNVELHVDMFVRRNQNFITRCDQFTRVKVRRSVFSLSSTAWYELRDQFGRSRRAGARIVSSITCNYRRFVVRKTGPGGYVTDSCY